MKGFLSFLITFFIVEIIKIFLYKEVDVPR